MLSKVHQNKHEINIVQPTVDLFSKIKHDIQGIITHNLVAHKSIHD